MFIFVLPFFVVSDWMLNLVFILYRLLHFLSLSLESRVLYGLFCCQESLQSMHSSFGYRNKDVDKNWFSHEILKSISKQKLLWHSSAALNSIFSKKNQFYFYYNVFCRKYVKYIIRMRSTWMTTNNISSLHYFDPFSLPGIYLLWFSSVFKCSLTFLQELFRECI